MSAWPHLTPDSALNHFTLLLPEGQASLGAAGLVTGLFPAKLLRALPDYRMCTEWPQWFKAQTWRQVSP